MLSSGALLVLQSYILWQKRGNHNGMKKYRILLFLFTLAFFVDNTIISYEDLLKYFYNVGHSVSLTGLTLYRLIARIIEVVAIFYFYILIYIVNQGKKH